MARPEENLEEESETRGEMEEEAGVLERKQQASSSPSDKPNVKPQDLPAVAGTDGKVHEQRVCNYCKRKGHFVNECPNTPERKKDKQGDSPVQNKQVQKLAAQMNAKFAALTDAFMCSLSDGASAAASLTPEQLAQKRKEEAVKKLSLVMNKKQ